MDGRGGDYPMQHPYWEHAGSGHPLAHLLLLVLFVLLVSAAVVFVYRFATRQRAGLSQLVPATGSPSADALGIVRLRYARGEIKRDEFLRMSADFGAPAEVAPADHPVDAPTVSDAPDAPTA